MSRADLGELIGAPSGRVSEILNRRRPLTMRSLDPVTPKLLISPFARPVALPLSLAGTADAAGQIIPL
jgi:hypothetical protein